jgi:hypothetical protein
VALVCWLEQAWEHMLAVGLEQGLVGLLVEGLAAWLGRASGEFVGCGVGAGVGGLVG